MALTLLPEWHYQKYVLIVWPHQKTDWLPIYHQIQMTYITMAVAIADKDHLVILSYNEEHRSEILMKLSSVKANLNNIEIKIIQTNDTWIRDYGPISCQQANSIEYFDFQFNGYGNKYPHQLDNRVPSVMLEKKLINVLQSNEYILEGGSIETDGNGVLITTTSCLLNPNRNGFTKQEIEKRLKQTFDLSKIYWIENTVLDGDDTDGHIDNFIRFIDESTIFYCECNDRSDKHYYDLQKLYKQLSNITNTQGRQYNLIPIPLPKAIFKNNQRLPASYLNFLITNNAIIVPSFNDQILDKKVSDIFNLHVTNKDIIFIDSTDLISQGGGIHCSTMQISGEYSSV